MRMTSLSVNYGNLLTQWRIDYGISYFLFVYRCDHIYHESCVVEWLALNSKCPLCKRDFRGKDFADDQDSGDEEERV